MSDACIFPRMQEDQPLNYNTLLDRNWVSDSYGFPDIDFLIDAVVQYPKETVRKCMIVNRPRCIVCKYPDEVVLNDGDTDDS